MNQKIKDRIEELKEVENKVRDICDFQKDDTGLNDENSRKVMSLLSDHDCINLTWWGNAQGQIQGIDFASSEYEKEIAQHDKELKEKIIKVLKKEKKIKTPGRDYNSFWEVLQWHDIENVLLKELNTILGDEK